MREGCPATRQRRRGSARTRIPTFDRYSTPHGITIDVPDWAPPEASQMMTLADYDPSITGTVVYPSYFEPDSPL